MILVSRPEYQITGEFLWFGLILHSIFVGKYSKRSKANYKADTQSIAHSIRQPVYVYHTMDHDPLKRKFVLSIGFTFHHYRITGDGKWAQMYILNPLEVSSGF